MTLPSPHPCARCRSLSVFIRFRFPLFPSTACVACVYIFPVTRPWPGVQSETVISPFCSRAHCGHLKSYARYNSLLRVVILSGTSPSTSHHCAFSDPWNAALVSSVYIYPFVFLNSSGDFLSSSHHVGYPKALTPMCGRDMYFEIAFGINEDSQHHRRT